MPAAIRLLSAEEYEKSTFQVCRAHTQPVRYMWSKRPLN